MTDLKKEKDANAQLQNVLERDQRVINGLKEEKNSLKAVKISYEEIRDAQKNWEEEKKGSEQLVRAYKRQVDSLNDQFRLKQQELQATLDKMKGVEFKNNELHSKVGFGLYIQSASSVSCALYTFSMIVKFTAAVTAGYSVASTSTLESRHHLPVNLRSTLK